MPHFISRKHFRHILATTMLTCMVIACRNAPSGFYTNITTGLSTAYSGIKSAQTEMVMNGEVLNHTDIPIGESFQIINQGVQGLAVKDGKVHISCSLQIQDAKDSIIFSSPDLFESQGFFHKDSASMLRCTINTGLPMEWEEKYKIKVIFSDLNGKGKIENTVTIRAIDIP